MDSQEISDQESIVSEQQQEDQDISMEGDVSQQSKKVKDSKSSKNRSQSAHPSLKNTQLSN
jgi:hypothetical protein